MDTERTRRVNGTDAMRPQVTRRDIVKAGVAFGASLTFGALSSDGRFSALIAHGQETVWLHVHIDRRTDEGRQISTAQAWTTSDKAGKKRVTVGTLHLVLEAFRHQTDQCNHCDYLRIEEVHSGSGVATATARAWGEDPSIGPVTKSIQSTGVVAPSPEGEKLDPAGRDSREPLPSPQSA